LSDTSQKLKLFENYNELYEIIILHVSLHLQAIIYITAGFIVLNKAKKIFVENYSSNTIESYKWLFQLILFSAILYTVAIVKNILKYSGQQDMFKSAQISVGVVVLCVVCWYVLKALRYPNLFCGVNSKTKLVTTLIDEKATVNSEEIEQLTSYMETEKPYLNSSLSIRNLAKEIEMNSRDLSILINQKLNQHFFDFVNEYRIKEAMDILGNPTKKEVTILEILYEVGFNSKSSFNTAFKKHTGKTPTEFRKST
jgi:AraC-like DNA-binding protein